MTHTPLEKSFLLLQKAQQIHDEKSHRDILNLNLKDRLKHMALHFCKYVGNIVEAEFQENSDAKIDKVLVDSLIICLASANAVNISLAHFAPQEAKLLASTSSFAKFLLSLETSHRSREEFVKKMAILSGKMAKTMESTDHMEAGNPREEMSALLPQMTFLVLTELARAGIAIEEKVHSRLLAIEKKSIFEGL